MTPLYNWRILHTKERYIVAIRVGILGFAHGHVSAYCDEWRKNPDHGIQVTIGWDHDAARRKSAADATGVEICEDIEQILAAKDIQAVVIGAETSLHADLVERAAAAGKTIVLQKPVALTIGEADRIVAAVGRHAVPFTMAWQMRVDPQNVQIRHMIQAQALGKVFMVRRRHGLPMGLDPAFADSWHVRPAYNRDIWADDASHPIDFIHWLLGVPESVTAEIESLHNPRIPMDNGIAMFRYPGGPLVEVCCSFTCTAAENTTEVICEGGTIIQSYGDVPSCNVPRQGDATGLKWYAAAEKKWVASEIPSPAQHGERIRGLAAPLAAFLHGDRPAIATAEDARTSLRMLLASYVSAREGRRIDLRDPAIERM